MKTSWPSTTRSSGRPAACGTRRGPVVKFIVKSVDEILQTEFGLPMGLADSSTIKVGRAIEQSKDKRTKDGMKHEEVEVHRVQILDPATGTGTFLAEVIQQVRDKFDGMEGMWPSYVEKNLIPRLHGFEILMASYTIAHLKLALTLKNTGYTGSSDKRLNVFLTNSLEEATPRATTLFAKWLSDEADAASMVKTETPIMVAAGNPPYSISSQNNNDWITTLVSDYKKNLNEKNIQPLSDDYIKFIRLGQYYVHKNGEGILAYISNNSFLDGIIHRQMRKSLLEEFDKIYILNLHGNSRRKETCPDGSPDENVFDIMQGVSINIFVKTEKKANGQLAEMSYQDLFGTRTRKYDFLNNNSLQSVQWTRITPSVPYHFFVPKDFSFEEEYNKFFSVSVIFKLFSAGIVTSKDEVNLWNSTTEVEKMVQDLKSLSSDSFRAKYNAGNDSRDWSVDRAKNDVLNHNIKICKYVYRPFDYRFLAYTGITNGVAAWPRHEVFDHFAGHNNVGLVMSKQFGAGKRFITYITDSLIDKSSQPFAPYYVFPKYLYAVNGEKLSNFKEWFVENWTNSGLIWNEEFVFDYIYTCIHSPKYRETYKEFLKIDFPRIPYPKDADQFHRLAEKGAELRKLHLMEGADTWKTGVTFPVSGTNVVEKVSFADDKVYINKDQYFGNVSELAWGFYIGGYQPAQKWLKDRKDRTLDFQDILHYGRIIYALQETDRIMKEIDGIGVV